MWIARAKQTGVGRAANDTDVPIRATRDGSIFTASWYQSLVLEGSVFTCSSGATDQGYTDPGTFGAGGIDGTEFDWLMGIPATVVVIPLRIKAIPEAVGTIAALDFLAIYGIGGVAGANSVAVTPRNMRRGGPASSCAVATVADAAGTALTSVQGTIDRSGGTHITGAAGDQPILDREWVAGVNGYAPLIDGAGAVPAAGTPLATNGQLAVFLSAQAATGFILVQFAELDATYF